MQQPTVKQVERQLERALRALGVGYSHHQEYLNTQRGDGTILLGRPVGVYFTVAHLSRVNQERVARVFRRLWHRGCRVHSCQYTNVQGWKDVHREVTLTF